MYKKTVLLAALATAMIPAASMAAPHVEFYFTRVGETTKINDLVLTPGATTFDLSVWYKIVDATTFPNFGAEAMVGYDRTNAEGSGATPMDLKIGLNGDENTAITNLSSSYLFGFKSITGGATALGQASDSIRPYGADVSLAQAGDPFDPGTDPVRMFDISFSVLNLLPGESYDLVLWDAGQGFQSTSYVDGSEVLRPGFNETLTVTNAVPEPASLIALGIGAVALIRRRRK